MSVWDFRCIMQDLSLYTDSMVVAPHSAFVTCGNVVCSMWDLILTRNRNQHSLHCKDSQPLNRQEVPLKVLFEKVENVKLKIPKVRI